MLGHAHLRSAGLVLSIAVASCGASRERAPSPTQGPAEDSADARSSSTPAAGTEGSAREQGDAAVPDCRLCFGKPTPGLEAELVLRARRASPCYDRALVRSVAARGRLTVRVRIGQSGSICSQRIVRDDLGDDELATCVRATLEAEGAAFPSPVGGCTDINVPFNFVPGPADAG